METSQRTPCTIEPAILDDIEDACDMQKVLAQVEGTVYDKWQMLEYLLDLHIHGRGRVLMARVNGQAVGCVVLLFMSDPRLAGAAGLVCLPGAPWKTAVRLMKQAADELARRGIVNVWATVGTDHNRNRRLYRAIGFRPLAGSPGAKYLTAAVPDLCRRLAERLN